MVSEAESRERLITLSTLHLPAPLSGLHRQAGVQLVLPASRNNNNAVPFQAIIADATMENLILGSFISTHVANQTFAGFSYLMSTLEQLEISHCTFSLAFGMNQGESAFGDATPPKFQVVGKIHVPFEHQGHLFAPGFFVCDHIFCQQEYESRFVAVLGWRFLCEYFVRTQYTTWGWTIQLPPLPPDNIPELTICCKGRVGTGAVAGSEGTQVANARGGFGIHFPSLPEGWDVHGSLSRHYAPRTEAAELIAALRALQLARGRLAGPHRSCCKHIAIYTDSTYLVERWNELIPEWPRNNYRTANKPIDDAALFWTLHQEVSRLTGRGVTVKFVLASPTQTLAADALSRKGLALGRHVLLDGPIMENAKPLVQWSPNGTLWLKWDPRVFSDSESDGTESRPSTDLSY